MVVDTKMLNEREIPGEDAVPTAPRRGLAASEINVLEGNSHGHVPPSELMLPTNTNLEGRKLSRGISRATDNEGLVWALRSGAAQPEPAALALSSDHVFLLPDMTLYPSDFRTFLEKDLLETAALVALESAGRLNWWVGGRVPGAPRLLPLATSGDGNCLPHAASLAAWGFHDRLLSLRSRVRGVLAGDGGTILSNSLKRRWRWSESRELARAGLAPTEAQWETEWREAVAAASPEPRASHAASTAPAYHGLDELHVFALAHVMRRPIVVFADLMLRDMRGEAIAPIPFGGIYLPLELDPQECSRAPILLAYDAGHFSALAPCEPLPPCGARVPLQDSTGVPLPIRFVVDPGDDFPWGGTIEPSIINRLLPDEEQRSNMLAAYLDLEDVLVSQSREAPPELRRSLDALSSSSKQINSVARQFGSIGRSMSNKIKKNFGSMAKLATKSSSSNGTYDLYEKGYDSNKLSDGDLVLCCRVLAARAAVQEEMVRNYLEDAWRRYTSNQQQKSAPTLRYGTGRSQFYAEADTAAHENAKKNAVTASKPAPDRTLYLSRSTFYDDRPLADEDDNVFREERISENAREPVVHHIEVKLETDGATNSPKPCRTPLCLFYGSTANNDYCSRCARIQE